MRSSRPKPAAECHESVRRQHSDELAEDYVEAIYKMQCKGESARVMHLQEIFGVSHVSVIRALKRIEARGLLSRGGRSGILLTEAGEKMAEEAAARHELVIDFLIAVGVPKALAEVDAEGIEHHISSGTLKVFQNYVNQSKKKAKRSA